MPGEHSQAVTAATGFLLRSVVVKRAVTQSFLKSFGNIGADLLHILSSTHSALKPLTCRILICFTMVLFPDSPAPSNVHPKKNTYTHTHTTYVNVTERAQTGTFGRGIKAGSVDEATLDRAWLPSISTSMTYYCERCQTGLRVG